MKTFYRSIVIIAFTIFGLSQNAKATHVAGVDFSYTCVGQDSFLITFNAFRDCSGASLGSTAPVTFTSSCGGSVSAQLTLQNGSTGTEVSQLCPTSIVSSTCNGGSLPGMQQYIYTGIVVLSPPCNSWTMAWSLCCRNTSVNLVGQANMYITATLNSAADSCNNSPVFNAQPIPYVCYNQVVNYNFGVTEADGDSIVYSFVNPMISATGPVTFAAGYTFTQPVPGVTLNTATGQLTFTPTTLGNFVLAVMACEYEYGTGVLKGCITRDIQFVVINCTNQQPLAPASGISNFSGTGVQIGPDSVEVCVGNNFSFDLVFTDPNALDSVTLFSNITTVLPGATISAVFGNPATITVSWTAQPGTPPFNNFTVTGVDDACPTPGIATASYNIIVVPSTYAGPDKTICQGTQWAQLGAVGGSLFTWTVLSGSPIDTVPTSPGYNTTCNHCQFPQVSPAVTTTYMVISNLSGTCVNVDTVVVNVAPNFNLFMPNDTLICSVDDYPLAIFTSEPTFSYTYNWSPAFSLDYDTIQIPLANPSDPTTYTVTIESAGGCKKTGSVFIDLSPPFPPNMQITGDTVLCVGQVTQLGIDFGAVPIMDCGPTTQGCIGITQDGDVGTGISVNTGSTFPAIYGGHRYGVKHQILYTATDLQNLGMTAGGMLNSIGFYVNTVGTPSTFANFEVKMGCTSETDMSNGWIFGNNMSVVVPSYTHTAIAGWNTHNFTSAYKWDGQSSLVFEICFNNVGNTTNGNSIMRYTPTGFQSVVYQSGNNSSICQTYAAVGFNGAVISNNRPNTRFNFCTGVDPLALNYSWSPSAGLTNTTILDPIAGPSASTTYQVIVTDTFGGCADTIDLFIDMVTSFNAGFQFNDPYCVSSGPDSLISNVGGGYFTGNAIDSNGWFYPDSAGVGPWPITYHLTTPALCANDSTMIVNVIALPNASFGYEEVCEGSSPITLIPATAGGVWGGQAISDTTAGVFDPAGLSAGTYPVSYTLTQPCLSTDTIGIRIIQPYNFTFNVNELTVCQDDTIHVGSNFTLNNSPLQGVGPTLDVWSDIGGNIDSSGVFDATGLAPGDYIVALNVTGLNGSCGTQKTMIVKVLKIDYPQFPSGLVFCSDENKAIVQVSPWLFGTGASYIQTPISPLGANDTLDIVAFGPNGKFDATTSGVGSWELEVTYTNLNMCKGVSTDTIYVLDTPVTPTPQEAAYCEGEDIYLFATGATADSMYWYSDAALTDTLGLGSPLYWGVAPNPSVGPITVYVTENNWECISPSVSYLLPIKEAPTAEFEMFFTDTMGIYQANVPHDSLTPSGDTPVYGYTPFNVIFDALNITSTDSVIWNHHYEVQPSEPEWVNSTNAFHVGFGYAVANYVPGELSLEPYITQLIVTNEFGCMDTASAEIYSVSSETVYNIFTPNGDGINDIFILPVFGLRDYHVEIYNRWGRKVYEWNDPTEGWDGSNQPDGVYYYVIIGLWQDDTEYKKQGTVTLTGSGK